MTVTFGELRREDEERVIELSGEGMNAELYVRTELGRRLEERNFWYYCTLEATDIIAAYDDDIFLGLMVVNMKGDEKRYYTMWRDLSSRIHYGLSELIYGEDPYPAANEEMMEAYLKDHPEPDGMIDFLVSDRTYKGVGTMLLKELERRYPGKTIALYTDDRCTYQFYDHRGFERVGEKDVQMTSGQKIVLKCMLYVKTLPTVSSDPR